MARLIRVHSLLCFLAIAVVQVQAQVKTGIPPFGSFGSGPDIINLANLNSHITVPVLHKPGRGTAFTYDLSYDSSVWYPVGVSGNQTWTPVSNFGWRGLTEVATGYISYTLTSTLCVDSHGNKFFGGAQTYSNWKYHDNFGRSHQFIGTTQSNYCTSVDTTLNTTTSDGSGFKLAAVGDSGSVFSKQGQNLNAPINSGSGAATAIDRNGNEISVNGSGSFYDTLSSTVAVLTVSGLGTPGSPTKLVYTAPSGASATYQLNYTNYTVATNFGFGTSIGEYKSSAAVPLITSIQLPDGSQYTITYEATPSLPSASACVAWAGTTCVTARIASITYPTGGTISYLYYNANSNFTACTTGNNGAFSDGSASCLLRTTPDGNWTYTRAPGTDAASTTTLKDAVGNVSTIQFQGIYETQRVTNNSLGATLLTKNTCYNGTGFPCTLTAVTLPITERDVINAVPTTGSGTLQTRNTTFYNSVGGLTETDDYSYGSGAVGSLLRKTTVTYASLGNITAFRQQVTVQNGTGGTVAQTNYNYDQTTPVAAPSNTPQLIPVSGSRGNLTSVQRCTNTSSCSTNYIQTSTLTYDTAGQLQTAKDALNNQTSLSYADNYYVDSSAPPNPPAAQSSPVPTDAFPTSVTLPVSGSLSYGYYYYSGQLAKSADQNGNASYNHFQDSLSRLTATFGPTVSYPGGTGMPWLVNVYASSDIQIDSYTGIGDTSYSASCTNCRHDEALMDVLGRTIHGYLVNDPEGQTIVDATYDQDGRAKSTSHPYRNTNDTTYGIETPTYDGLGRTIKVTHQDSTYSQTLYGPAIGSSGNATQSCSTSTYGTGYPILSVDESARKRQIWTDALGRTIEGDEPDSGGNLTSYTCYSYDVLGNLLQVINGSQTRTYAYDSLSRGTSVTIPERANSSGSNCPVTYTYDNNSNIKTRVAPAPNQTSCTAQVTTTYSYDGLNRLTKISYSDGTTPTVQYGYDGAALSGCTTAPPSLSDPNPRGRRTSMCDGSGGTSWAHDAAGRVSTESRMIAGVNKTISYGYNLDSTIGTVTYPSGKTVTYTTSNAERLTSAKDTSSSTQFAMVASYAPTGALQGMITGQISGGFGGVTESHTYNSSLEYTSTQATSTVGTALNLSLNYNLSGGDNGTVTSITNNVDNGRTQTLGYDPMNRISSMSSQATSGVDCWGQTFAPDPLGNLDSITSTKCNSTMLNLGIDANNHINNSGFGYDAAGNMTQDGTSGVTYSFDAENHIYKITGIAGGPYCYFYDGNGLRVAKKSGANSDCTGGTFIKLYWRSISGDALAGTDNTGSVTNAAYNEYVFFSGRRIASRNGTGTIFYYFADQIGTIRTITTGNGTGQTPGQLCYDADFTPYGLELPHTERLQTTACPPSYKFTGYERDSETGLDYAFARYYSSSLNRFYSTDPLGGSIGSLQSHNGYAYVLNNPSNFIDPTGMDTIPMQPECPSYSRQDHPCRFRGGDGGGSCNLDGVDTSCSDVFGLLNSGAAGICPANNCDGLRLLYGPGGSDVWQQLVQDSTVSTSILGVNQGSTNFWKWVTVGGGDSSWMHTFWAFMNGYWDKVPFTLTIYYPIPQTRGIVQVQVPLSILPKQGVGCVGGGLALGSPSGKYVSAGPLLFGDLNNAQSVLSGWSWNINAQTTPFIGYQGSLNSSGQVNGPTVATASGFTVGGSGSYCGPINN
jgi:RHS repeat-associated protein